MNFMRRLGIMTGLLACLAIPAKAWENLSITRNPNNNLETVTIQRGTNNTYGFLSLYHENSGDSLYGEFRVKKKIGKGFNVGVEYNGGTGVDSLIRPQVGYSRSVGSVFLDVKFSPLESTGRNGQQLGLYASTKFRDIGMEGWLDIDFINGKTAKSGELEVSKKIGDNVHAIARMEHYHWRKSPTSYSIGLKYDF